MNTNSTHTKPGGIKQNKSSKSPAAKLIFQYGFRAVTVLMVSLGLFVFYHFITVSAKKIFSENYQPYELRVMRGLTDSSILKDAYKNGNMDSVIWEFNSLNSPQPEEYLLAGIAFLENKQPAKAIETFKTMIQKNTISKTDYFESDAEYYLAMSYLDNQEPDKAMPIFEKIQADTDHPYNTNVSEWFLLNVQTSIAKK
jgi:tetratricopeptide (TPR) repeat protein